jgi:hypothetical protein
LHSSDIYKAVFYKNINIEKEILMPYMVVKGSFTRPNTDIEFYDASVHRPVMDDLLQKGLIIDKGFRISEDQLTQTRFFVAQIETPSDINIVTSSLRTDPNFYEMHILFQEYCDQHQITRGPVVIELYTSDWVLTNEYNFMVADLF